MHADAEFRISSFVFLAPDCDNFQRTGLLPFKKISKNLFEKFCPSVSWDSPVRPFWVISAFLDFRVELGFRGRFLAVRPGSRLLGHPTGGGSILITLRQTSPYKIDSSSIFDLRADFRVSGQPSAVGPEFSTVRPPETLS